MTQLVEVVRWISPTSLLLPSTSSRARFSGHSICSMLSLNTAIRVATEGFSVYGLGYGLGYGPGCGPSSLLSRKGAVDHRLMSEGGRVYPRPPASILIGRFSPVNGSCVMISSTGGRLL